MFEERRNLNLGGKRSGAGRRAVNINLTELERLCSIQCTDQELASFFEVDVRTIERRKKKPAFAAALERGRAKGRVSIRRMLFTLAAKGNVAAAIFLAKNLLGLQGLLCKRAQRPGRRPNPRVCSRGASPAPQPTRSGAQGRGQRLLGFSRHAGEQSGEQDGCAAHLNPLR